MTKPLAVVLDKSFLRGSSADIIDKLCTHHNVLIIDDLMYELLDNPQDREQCFAKLPTGGNALIFLKGIGPLIRYENTHGRPASPLSEHRIPGILSINRRFRERCFNFSIYDAKAEEWKETVAKDVGELIDLSTTINRLWPNIEGNPSYTTGLLDEVSNNREIIQSFYGKIADQCSSPKYKIDENWVSFRWLQAKVMYCIQLFSTHKGQICTARPTDVEHDLHDLRYLVYASLSGSIATKDEKLKRNFFRLRPDGVVL